MFKVKTLNEISPVIHDILTAGQYIISKDEPSPDAILVRSAAMHDLELPKTLMAISRAGAGVNNIPLDKCTEQGIVVFNTPGANANAVAELTMAGLLLASRDIWGGLAFAQSLKGKEDVEKLVEKGKNAFVGPELRGKTLAVLGLGAIGALVANAAVSGFGMNVVGYDPYISVAHAWSLSRSVHQALTMEEAIRDADYISLHIPLTAETKGMVNASFIKTIKPGARLLNFSRGELCAAKDILKALEAGDLSKYVTDFPSDELLNHPNIICIPHLGASTPESEDRCADMAAQQIKDYLERGIIKNSVNLPEVTLGAPEGSRVLLIHKNVPGLVSAISTLISGRGINIAGMINKSRGDFAVTVLELSQAPDDPLIDALFRLKDVVRVRKV